MIYRRTSSAKGHHGNYLMVAGTPSRLIALYRVPNSFETVDSLLGR
jgi:hypothetical protein